MATLENISDEMVNFIRLECKTGNFTKNVHIRSILDDANKNNEGKGEKMKHHTIRTMRNAWTRMSLKLTNMFEFPDNNSLVI